MKERGDAAHDRRAFLRALPATAAALALGGRASARTLLDAVNPVQRPEAIGIQLYTLRSLLAQDLEGTLAAVARIGYREVEFAGLYGRSAADMRAILDRNGLRAVASHHSLREVRDDGPRVLNDATTLGQHYVVVPSIDQAYRTADGYRRVADEFNRAGEAARAADLQFGYHNHDFEFSPVNGVVPYDLLLERCDASLVVMELDLFWIVNGGRDPLAYIAAHPGRFPLLHVKDRTAAGEMVNVGEGAIDFRAIFAQRERAGIRHAFVEHDRPASPLEDVRTSFQNLRRISS